MAADLPEDGTVTLTGATLDADGYFLEWVRSADPWWYLLDPESEEVKRRPPKNTDEVIDFAQALYRLASLERPEDDGVSPATIERGRSRMRELVNPVLGLLEPPVQIATDGTIVQVTPTVLTPLVEHPLPSEVATDDIADDVRSAIAQFRRRDATRADRQSACVRLAGVLETLRESGETKAALVKKDDDRLFEIANQFAFRHRNAAQSTDYDSEIFNEWVFYCQLAAIRLTARLRARGKP